SRTPPAPCTCARDTIGLAARAGAVNNGWYFRERGDAGDGVSADNPRFSNCRASAGSSDAVPGTVRQRRTAQTALRAALETRPHIPEAPRTSLEALPVGSAGRCAAGPRRRHRAGRDSSQQVAPAFGTAADDHEAR